MRYYVQFTAGLGTLVTRFLAADLGVSRVLFSDDSAVVLESDAPPQKVARLPFVKNAFLVLTETKRVALPSAVRQLIRALEQPDALQHVPRRRAFRTMTHLDGGLVPLPRPVRSELEAAIAARTSGRLQTRGSGEEFWIVGRREYPRLLLGWRLPRSQAETLKGALAGNLAHLLVRASVPDPGDVFLDPFAGSGALVQARLQFPATSVLYSDLRLNEVEERIPPGLRGHKRVRFLSEDATRLSSIQDGGVGTIVTDPPWGEFDALDRPYGEFVDDMAVAFARVLDPHAGRLVLLVSRRAADTYRRAFSSAGLPLGDGTEILVNGHPATVLTATRRGPEGPRGRRT